MLFSVTGSGVIRLRKLRNGDMAVAGIGKSDLVDIINRLCVGERAYWHHGYGEWVIKASHLQEAFEDLNRLAIPLERIMPR
jgi:hypothetical protein